jgi:hypothetical protein
MLFPQQHFQFLRAPAVFLPQGYHQGQPLTTITINRILKRRGLVRKKDSHAPATVCGLSRRRRFIPVWCALSSALHYGRVRHPQTQGKVGRFHRTLDESLRYHGKPSRLEEWPRTLEEFRRIYNEQRPHEALQVNRPIERYRVSSRSYQSQPREWEYPSGSKARKLNAKGVLYWEGQQWCEALAGRPVRVEEGLLSVSYRHMYMREIDREQKCTRALVLPRGVGGAPRSPPGPPTSLPKQQKRRGNA